MRLDWLRSVFRQPAQSLLPFLIGLNALTLDAGELGVEGTRLQGSLQMTSLSLNFLIWKMGIMTFYTRLRGSLRTECVQTCL